MEAIYISNNQFSVSGDKTNIFVPYRRLKLDIGVDGEIYDHVGSSYYSAPYTIVDTTESGLTPNLVEVNYSIMDSSISGSLPDHSHSTANGDGGVLSDSYYAITSNLTLYISASGSDATGDGSLDNPYGTFTGPWSYLTDKRIRYGSYVYITYLDGNHTIANPITTHIHPDRDKIFIYGSTVLDRSITSVQSSSGSSGAYSIVFNMNDVSNVLVGEYMMVTNNATGGTNPTYACGVHQITNVDVPNNRLTVTSKHRKGAPSGAVTASVKIFKTVLTRTTGTLFQITNKNVGRIGSMALVGGTSGYGVECTNSSIVYCDPPIAVSGFSSGVVAYESSMTQVDNCGASGGNSYGAYAQESSSMQSDNFVSSGHGSHGVVSIYTASIQGSSMVSTGNVNTGFLSYINGFIITNTSSATGNGAYGWQANYVSVIRRTGTCVDGNNTSGNTSAINNSYIQTA